MTTPASAPPGVETKFYSRWADRPLITPRLILVHTNAARGEGSVDSASNWAERNVTHSGSYTIPHYQVDRDGRARKILPSNRRGIANSTADWLQERDGQPDVSFFSLAIETADTGTDDDPTISAFTPKQIEVIAEIVAFEVEFWGIPVVVPDVWYGAGVAAHTDPFPYPHWTTVSGKTCPGAKKKAQMPTIRTRVAELLAPPSEEDPVTNEEIAAIARATATAIYGYDIPHPMNPDLQTKVGYVWGSTLKLAAQTRAELGLSKAEVDRIAAATAARVGSSASAVDIARALIAQLAEG